MKVQQTIATQVLQLGLPICNFPTKGINASKLSIIIWDVIAKLLEWGSHVDYILQDCGEENRQLIKLYFDMSSQSPNYTSSSIVYPNNNIYHVQGFLESKSKRRNIGDGEKSTWKLMYEDKKIIFDR